MGEICICFRRKTCEASSPSSSISLTRMDSLPDGVVEYILSKLSNAKDVASCNCVSKKWKDLMSYRKSLCFPRGIFNNLTCPQTPDSIVMQMVSSVSRLEELVVSCPFTIAGLSSWLLVVGSSLKNLELRVAHAPNKSRRILECIQAAKNLEYLKLWRVIMARTPKLDVFHKLRDLEICAATLEDSVLMEALRATPNLTKLVLDGCTGLSTVRIELVELRHCQLDVCRSTGSSITLRAPKIQYLRVKGWSWVRVHETNYLKTFSTHNYVEMVVPMVELGDNLIELESLCIQGFVWHWEVITKMLQLATQVKHLCLKTDIFSESAPHFPEIDFLDFFKTHPKLKSLNIFGGMFFALCNNHMTTLKNVDSSVVIPCLEEVVITLISPKPSNAKKVIQVIESLLKYGNKLKKININVKTHEMDDGFDDFNDEIRRLFQDSTTECHVICKQHR